MGRFWKRAKPTFPHRYKCNEDLEGARLRILRCLILFSDDARVVQAGSGVFELIPRSLSPDGSVALKLEGDLSHAGRFLVRAIVEAAGSKDISIAGVTLLDADLVLPTPTSTLYIQRDLTSISADACFLRVCTFRFTGLTGSTAKPR